MFSRLPTKPVLMSVAQPRGEVGSVLACLG